LVQSGVDDLHASVAQRARYDLGAAIVAIKAWLGYDNPEWRRGRLDIRFHDAKPTTG
jgi:hypothetical protein